MLIDVITDCLLRRRQRGTQRQHEQQRGEKTGERKRTSGSDHLHWLCITQVFKYQVRLIHSGIIETFESFKSKCIKRAKAREHYFSASPLLFCKYLSASRAVESFNEGAASVEMFIDGAWRHCFSSAVSLEKNLCDGLKTPLFLHVCAEITAMEQAINKPLHRVAQFLLDCMETLLLRTVAPINHRLVRNGKFVIANVYDFFS